MTGSNHFIGWLFSALLIFNGAPRCAPAAKLFWSLFSATDLKSVDLKKPSARVHCDEKAEPKSDSNLENPPSVEDEDCRCHVLTDTLAFVETAKKDAHA